MSNSVYIYYFESVFMCKGSLLKKAAVKCFEAHISLK